MTEPMITEQMVEAAAMAIATRRDAWKPGERLANDYRLDARLALEAATALSQAEGAPYQQRVYDWLLACFGEAISQVKTERNHRFLEEALEVVQAGGCTASEAHRLVDYVFERPVGELGQEVGGAIVCLAALCSAHGRDMMQDGETELARIWTKVEKIRAKQAAKPKHSPLPEALPTRPREQEGTEPVAEIVSAHGDPEAFGERELKLLADIQKFPYNTKLYVHPPASFQAGAEGWNHDMAAAPKDGTEILAWRDDQGVFVCRHANMEEFVAKDQHGDPIEEYDDSYENWWHDRWGWLELELAPTAWMPLPAEPLPLPASSEGR